MSTACVKCSYLILKTMKQKKFDEGNASCEKFRTQKWFTIHTAALKKMILFTTESYESMSQTTIHKLRNASYMPLKKK